MRYWLKVVAVAVVLTSLLIGVIGAVAVGFTHLPEPAQPWVAGGSIFVVLVTVMASGIHVWFRIR